MKNEVVAKLIDTKKASILRILTNAPEEMYLQEIAHKSNVPLTSTFRILRELVSLELVERRQWKTTKVYSYKKTEKNSLLKELFQEDVDGVAEFVHLVEPLPAIQNIILHGTQKKGKANILLIGEGIETAKVDAACQSLKEKGFDISYLTLTKDQYAQMTKMGLYSGEKTLLKGTI